MSKNENQYLDILKHVLTNGYETSDRTGTNTLSSFGLQMRFNLEEGFPLLTTKKVFWKGVVEELLWMLNGDTNTKYLKDKDVHIWDAWEDSKGNLGPIYGKQWREWDNVAINKIITKPKPDQSHITGTVQGIGSLGDPNIYVGKPLHKELYQTWYGMLKRCYNKDHSAYHKYGGAGIFVEDRWLVFSNFYQDVQKLNNWTLKLEYPDEYTLDKDFYGSNFYSRDVCRWSSKIEQSSNISNNDNFFLATDPEGNSTMHYGLRPFCNRYDLCRPAVSQVISNKYKSNYGWTFDKLIVPDGYVARFTRVDQIRSLIAEIKHNSSSRRLIVSAWNVSELSRMALVPCHMMFQFKVYGDELHCQLYQRSADLFLGVPFNIASYSLLTHMIAQQTGLKATSFVHTIGDAHIYTNHIDQVKEQLSREPVLDVPQLIINRKPDSIFDYKFGDFTISNYKPHPSIKAPVAV